MAFLISDAERCTLRPGSNTIGGHEADAVALTSLAGLQPAAVITIEPDGSAYIHRLAAGVIVKVDGEPLGAAPHPLIHGARLVVGTARLMYAQPTAQRDRASGASAAGDPSEAPTELVAAVPAADGTGRLVEVRTGRAFAVPSAGLVIGRSGGCDVVVDAKGVSRRHAVVKPDGPGFVVVDGSSNGTSVNGTVITGTRVLAHGDVLRIGAEDFRLEVDAALPPATARDLSATEMVAGVAGTRRARGSASPRASAPNAPTQVRQAPRPFALLEVTGGPLSGKTFRVERAVCAIGRGDNNDIRLSDGSVSASHATLLLKRGTWYALDLSSANGTYVDGYRVAGERALPDGGTLRAGDVVMRFRVLAEPSGVSNQTAPAGGVWRRLSKLWQS
jgi:pSer/pThr/pTyr-binding forkhead associated (FHA) protein